MKKLIGSIIKIENLFRQNIESFGYRHDQNQHEFITDSSYIPSALKDSLEKNGIEVTYRRRPLTERILGDKKQVVFRFEDEEESAPLEKKMAKLFSILGVRIPTNREFNAGDVCHRPIISGIRISQKTERLDSAISDEELKKQLGLDEFEEYISELDKTPN
jgi:hypothetical protein